MVHRTRNVFTIARHLFIATWIQSKSSKPFCLKAHCNITLPSMPRFSECHNPSGSAHLLSFSLHVSPKECFSRQHDHKYIYYTDSFASSLLSFAVFFITLFSNILFLYSSLNVRDQVWHPYWTTGKIKIQ